MTSSLALMPFLFDPLDLRLTRRLQAPVSVWELQRPRPPAPWLHACCVVGEDHVLAVSRGPASSEGRAIVVSYISFAWSASETVDTPQFRKSAKFAETKRGYRK